MNTKIAGTDLFCGLTADLPPPRMNKDRLLVVHNMAATDQSTPEPETRKRIEAGRKKFFGEVVMAIPPCEHFARENS